jgi:NOL1/NOP2/fmu family ribosome biogenesis protein
LPRFESVEREAIIAWWAEQFGIPEEAFDDMVFFRKGANAVWMVVDGLTEGVRYDTVGITIMRSSSIGPDGWRPTGTALQALAEHITHNRVSLDREHAVRFIAGEEVSLTDEHEDEGRRYVLVCYKGRALGCGLASSTRLIPQVSKDRRIRDIVLP